MDTRILQIVSLSRVPLDPQLLSLPLCEQGYITQALVWIGNNAFQEDAIGFRHPLNGTCLKQIRIVLPYDPQSLIGLHYLNSEIKFGSFTFNRESRYCNISQKSINWRRT